MKAEVGDELVVESTELGQPRRVGTIIALKTADGSPPYLVHWVAGDYDSLIYPGPSTRMQVHHHHKSRNAGRLSPPGAAAIPQAGIDARRYHR